MTELKAVLPFSQASDDPGQASTRPTITLNRRTPSVRVLNPRGLAKGARDEERAIAELEARNQQRREYRRELLAELNRIEELYFGDWYLQYAARQVREIPDGTPDDRIWTWIDGPRFNGDIDCIVPGFLPELAIKLFVTDMPHIGGRLRVRVC